MKNSLINSKLVLIKFLLLLTFCQSVLHSNQRSWRCTDDEFSELILRPYNDLLYQESPDSQGPDVTSDLYVYLEGEVVTEILAINSENEADPLNMAIYNRLDKELKESLIKRKYNWDHINPDEYSNFFKGRNAYEFANHKIIRDHSWWARNLVTINPFTFNNSFILRPEPGRWSIMFKQGDEDIGYPSILSRNSRVFLSTEPTKIFLNLPWNPRNISYGEVHPLESVSGGGLSFDMELLGGMVSYNSIEKLNYADAFDPDNVVYNKWSGLLYWTRSFKFNEIGRAENSKDHPRYKPYIPKGTQRLKFGLNYSQLVYGRLDSTNQFSSLEVSDIGKSFNLYLNWSYVSDPKIFNNSYNYYSKLKGYFQANIGEKFKLNMGTLYSLSPSLAIGFNIAWAEPITYLKGQDDQYLWKPGFVISPNFTLRF